MKLLSTEVNFRENEISENQAYLEFRAGSKSYLFSEEPILGETRDDQISCSY